MVVLGPLVLLAVGALDISGISTHHGAHSPARHRRDDRTRLPGRHRAAAGTVSTEDLRQAVIHYRALLGDLLGEPARAVTLSGCGIGCRGLVLVSADGLPGWRCVGWCG